MHLDRNMLNGRSEGHASVLNASYDDGKVLGWNKAIEIGMC